MSDAWIGEYAQTQQQTYAIPGTTDTDYSVNSVEPDDTYDSATDGTADDCAPSDGQLLHYDDGYYIVQ